MIEIDDQLAAEVRKREGRMISVYPKRFYHDYRDNPDGTKRAIEMVTIAKRGVSIPSEVNKRWKDVSPVEKEVLEPHYLAWKKGESAPVSGTPLEAWAADPEMVQVLNQVNIRSVEEFVSLEDHLLIRLSIPGGREKQKRAKAFLEARENTAKVSEEVADLRTKLEARDRDIAELKALIERHAIKEETKRGPGRPRKTPLEAVN